MQYSGSTLSEHSDLSGPSFAWFTWPGALLDKLLFQDLILPEPDLHRDGLGNTLTLLHWPPL
jgi:hypothetical protein